jgi:hypothetical protein
MAIKPAQALCPSGRKISTQLSLSGRTRNHGTRGRALKLGAGVLGHQAYEFANANDGIVIGSSFLTVGIAGGFVVGGGHSPLATKFELASDQVLE